MKPIFRLFATAALLLRKDAVAQNYLDNNHNSLTPSNGDRLPENSNYPEYVEVSFNGDTQIEQNKQTINFHDGGIYVGEVFNDKMHGSGVLTWPNGDRYDGDFFEGRLSGKGVLTLFDGEKYEGEFHEGKKHGKGVMTWLNGEKYEGELHDGEIQGKGVLTLPDGEKYEGEFHEGKKHGKGILTWADGNRYEGEFRNGERHGKGVFIALDGTRREEEFRNDKIHFETNSKAPNVENSKEKVKQDTFGYILGYSFSGLLGLIALSAMIDVISVVIDTINERINPGRRREVDIAELRRNNQIIPPTIDFDKIFRPRDEINKAIRGFAKNIAEMEFDFDSLEPEQKEALMLLGVDKAEEIFDQILGITYDSSDKDAVLRTINEQSFVKEIPQSAEKDQLITLLTERITSFHEYRNITKNRDNLGGLFETNFIYNQALLPGNKSRIIDRNKLSEFIEIFREGVRDYCTEVHAKVYEEEAKTVSKKVLEELVEKVSMEDSNSTPLTSIEKSEVTSLKEKIEVQQKSK